MSAIKLPDFTHKPKATRAVDLENFFKDFEMNKFLEECDYLQ